LKVTIYVSVFFREAEMKNEIAELKRRPWWLTLIVGIFALIVGGILLWAPAKTATNTWILLVFLLGLYWLVTGVLEIAFLSRDRSQWGWKLFSGIISILIGGYILVYPTPAAIALPQIIVLVLGIWGVVQGILLVTLATQGGGWASAIWGGLAIVFGIILILNWTNPGFGVALVWAIAAVGVAGGIFLIIQSLRQRTVVPVHPAA
jgi:uncharacterized membrane protein HdeD (DUF308 family)